MKIQPRLLIASLSIGLVSFSFAQDFFIGDVNGDNKVDATDVDAIVSHILNLTLLSGRDLENADINADASIDVVDLVSLIQKVITPEPTVTPDLPEVPESPLFVDLGLKDSDGQPILWATRNIGADQPNDYGGLYAWAETSAKSFYSWGTYKWISNGHINKYYSGDGITHLEESDDIARAVWGEEWRMPTAQEMDMLRTECSYQWYAKGNSTFDGVAGVEITGPNSNKIFLPAAGYNTEYSGLIERDNWCIYWTSDRRAEDHIDAFKFAFSIDGPSINPYAKRFEGRSVRPIHIYQKTDSSEDANQPENPDTPVGPEEPDNPNSEQPDQPENPENPAGPEDPDDPNTEQPDQPENPENPAGPEEPDDPSTEQPDQPENPENPSGPEEPDNPNTEQPDQPENPETPDTPDAPNGTDEPGTEQPNQPSQTLPSRPYIDLGITDANGNSILWGTCNIGATEPQQYGNLYTWGNTTTTSVPTWNNYKWGTQNHLSKYNNSDNLIYLDETDDIASMQWGEKWQTPNYEHVCLLKALCSFQWYSTVDSPYPGVAGVLITGPNGNTLFLPAAGYHDGNYTNEPSNQNNYAIYWTNERLVDSPDKAYMFSYSSSNTFSSTTSAYRFQARAIRPVFVVSELPKDPNNTDNPEIENPNTPDNPTEPDTPDVPEEPNNPDNSDDTGQPDNTDNPDNPNDPGNSDEPGNTNDPDNTEDPTPEQPNTPEQPETPETPDTPEQPETPDTPDNPNTEQPSEPEIPTQDIHPYVDLGQTTTDGHPVLWATCNVGAKAEYEYGGLYAWGEIETKSQYEWSNYVWGNKAPLTKYNTSDKLSQLEPIDDVATQLWGEDWHIPTADDILFIENNCTHTWISAGNSEYNGVIGVKITGPNGNSIFLPAAGYHDGATATQQGRYGIYWSSTRSSSDPMSARMFAYSGHKGLSKDGVALRYQARSIRPVRIDYETTRPISPDTPDTPETPDVPDPVIPEVDPVPVQPENTFLLENDRVYHFVRDFQYSSRYDYTKMPQYCDTTYTIGKHQDWPRGVTLGEVTYYNLVPGRVYTLKRVEKGKQTDVTIKTTGQVRTFKMEGIDNVRDLGGWVSSINGKHVRYERLYRGTELTTNQKDIHYLDSIGSRHEMTNSDRKVLLETMGVKAELDFRAYDEKPNNFKRSSALGTSIHYHECYLDYHDISYNYVDNKDRLRLAFKFVLEELRQNHPVYFHCVWGSDRTGLFSAVMLGLLGVSNSDIDKEFELSSFSNHLRVRYKESSHKFATQYLINAVNGQSGSTLADKFKNWLISADNGAKVTVTSEEIEEFRTLMLE